MADNSVVICHASFYNHHFLYLNPNRPISSAAISQLCVRQQLTNCKQYQQVTVAPY